MMGENPGQNTPAQTTQTMVEMGMKIYNAIYKRVWRSMKEEFRKLYILNGIWLPEHIQFGPSDAQTISKQDYKGDPNRIVPVADPNITSENQRLQQAVMLAQRAATTPGYNWEVVEHRFLSAARIDDIAHVYPGPKSPEATPLPNPKAALEQIKQQTHQAKLEFEKMKFAGQMQEEMRVNSAKIAEIESKALLEAAEAEGIKSGHQVEYMNAMVGMLKLQNEDRQHRIDSILKGLELGQDQRQHEQTLDHERAMATVAKRSGNGSAATVGAGTA